MLRNAVALAALACAGSAVAQTSNCMNIGGGMVHCDNMGTNGTSSSTDCTSIGGGMVTCNTMGTVQPTPDMSHPQTNGTALNFIGDLLARSQERSFQKKVAQMLAAGDCQSAANLAFAHRRFDMSNQIRRSCATNRPPDAISAEQFMAGQPLPPAGSTRPQGSQQPPVAFDLWCEGTETKTSKSGLQEIHYSRLFRISLDSGRFCDGDCATTQVLAKVDPYAITFYDTPISPNGYFSQQSINRENGELVQMSVGVDGSRGVLAKCERRAFSGFPQRQF